MKDKFYTDTSSSWDAVRIPLFKPYEIVRLNGSKEWIINLVEIPGSISNVNAATVLNDNIIVHAAETYCNNAKVKEAWFIIIPEKHIEKCFDNKNDFTKYLASLRINEPKLHSIDSLYEKFKKRKTIQWQ